ncbi:hypothetical protein DL96DRAFT_1590194 [Flagelloscypha sp. PMI_526]|nr:hypothetical protein DL96DRAFT_1590194 [Flagelloscypha sp. PMI_526]
MRKASLLKKPQLCFGMRFLWLPVVGNCAFMNFGDLLYRMSIVPVNYCDSVLCWRVLFVSRDSISPFGDCRED